VRRVNEGSELSEIVRFVGEGVKLGRNVKVWHFTYIGDEAEIGDETTIGSLVHLDYGVRVGRRCRIEGMAYLPPQTVLEDDVFLGPGVVITNDPYPPSKRLNGVHIERGAVIGAGAVLKAGIRVGAGAVVGMGAVVTKDVPPGTVAYGHPATARYPLDEYRRRRAAWEQRDPSG
jgi:acetyltransferase-like isoleucine patch superfamily enzyme